MRVMRRKKRPLEAWASCSPGPHLPFGKAFEAACECRFRPGRGSQPLAYA
jgi:hypothetical protein